MSQIKLYIQSASDRKIYNLEKERNIIGRAKSCDIVLDDNAISRQHAAIIYKFESVYIENISSTGRIYKKGEIVEYVELQQNEVVELGPFKIFWQNSNEEVYTLPQSPNAIENTSSSDKVEKENEIEEPLPATLFEDKDQDEHEENNSDVYSFAENESPQMQSEQPENGSNLGLSSDDEKNEFLAGNPASLINAEEGAPPSLQSLVASDLSDASNISEEPKVDAYRTDDSFLFNDNIGDPKPPSEKGPAQNQHLSDFELANAATEQIAMGGNDNTADINALSLSDESKTSIMQSSLIPTLRVTKGDNVGQEYRLDSGNHWIVGRGNGCHIQIFHPKLSRQHFEILKVNDVYRVKDSSSSRGLKVNGAVVTDAPIKPFDSIQAGPIELQFLLSQKENPKDALPDLNPMPQNLVGVNSDQKTQVGEGTSMSTQFLSPAVYGTQAAHSFQYKPQITGVSSIGFNTSLNPAALNNRSIVDKWKNLPSSKQRLYGMLALVVVLTAVYLVNEPPTEQPKKLPEASAAKIESQNRNPANTLAPEENGQVPPEFETFSEEQKNEIRALYSKAESAYAAEDWQAVFENTNKILKQLSRYRRSSEMLGESQKKINDAQISALQNSTQSTSETVEDIKEQVNRLIEEGDKALQNEEWDLAYQSFEKALIFDPTDERAEMGMIAANSKNKSRLAITKEVPTQAPVEELVKVGTEEALFQEQLDYMKSLRLEFNTAKRLINNGKYLEALPLLKQLELKLLRLDREMQDEIRSPASVKARLYKDLQKLQSSTTSALDATYNELDNRYGPRLADAEQFTSNRQYVSARKIYDEIIRIAPDYDKARRMRQVLYGKIISEGKARFQEGLIYESVGRVELALQEYNLCIELLTDVEDPLAENYYRKVVERKNRIKP